MRPIHAFMGWAVVLGFAAIWLWGLVAWIVRAATGGRAGEPGRVFWGVLGGVQALLIVQALAGVALLVAGGRVPVLHYVYGAIFPILLLMVAHVLAREAFRHAPWAPFALAAFFSFGLTLRALQTGGAF